MLKQLVQAISIHIANNKASGIGNARGNCETFGKVWHALNATESCGKQRSISLNPPKCRYVPMNVDLNLSGSRRPHKCPLTAPSPWSFGMPGMAACRYLWLATTSREANKKPNLRPPCYAGGSVWYPYFGRTKWPYNPCWSSYGAGRRLVAANNRLHLFSWR
jgi:hypothetical protein